MNDETNNTSAFAKREEAILDFWQREQVFEKSVIKHEGTGKEFVFFEGPPTANGKPGIHHLEARAFKDAIPRYKTMRGFHVRRKGGWDTHGLPVELQVEKELGLKSKKEIEGFGIALFNQKCKESVWTYLDIWNKFTKRIGYWVDQVNPYVTYHNDYIESLWNIVGKVNDQQLLYKDYKVVPWCPRCGTALSSHELAQGYQDDKDLSVYVKFKIVGQENTYILAWTTTPWTLPGNVALAVGSEIKYGKWKITEGEYAGDTYIIAVGRATDVFKDTKVFSTNGNFNEVAEVSYLSGSELVGLSYEPLYPYLRDNLPESEVSKVEKAFKIYAADFVTTEDGTGVVHTALMYGQDDFELGTKIGLPKYHLVNEDGTFKSETDFLAGRFVKDEATAVEIIKDLAHRGLLFKKEKYEHSYPHCWRCKTALIYYARDSWYIKMSSLKEKLIEENRDINWEPSYIRDGRFGEWLKDIKDWAVSRERYWGTPLPVWETEDGARVVIDSMQSLREHTKKSGNTYIVMRHGESEHNLQSAISINPNAPDHLTENGRAQVKASGEKLKSEHIDIIVRSPFIRLQETAAIVCKEIGFPEEEVIVDNRLGEMFVPSFEGKTWTEYHDTYPKTVENFSAKRDGDESYLDVKKRMMAVIADLEEKYKGKKILILTHGGPLWLLVAGVKGYSALESLDMIRHKEGFHYFQNAEFQTLDYVPLPVNENFELDVHKPYIDEVKLETKDGKKLTRVKEVMDVWFDSGAMPFAQDHYPFEGSDIAYPADFICEAIDQTRGWFYTLHAVGALVGRGKAYKNVICLGHILDKEGKKMSKSLGNIVDPWIMIEKYGVDTLRFWMYTVNQPGESKNFDEKTVLDIQRKVFNLLDNVYAFYELYRDTSIETNERPSSTHVLDRWILAKLDHLTGDMTQHLDQFQLLEPGRAIRSFIDDLSTWYVRRSRERLKDGDTDAKQTLYFVLKTTAKLLAPFAPFTAEDLYLKLRIDGDCESVHLESWPKINDFVDSSTETEIAKMAVVRDFCTQGNFLRKRFNIPVKQPLQSITIPHMENMEREYQEIIKDELNIKEVLFGGDEVVLNTEITSELKQEGDVREFMRAIQEMRKQKNLKPDDRIQLMVATDNNGKNLLETFSTEIQKTVGATAINFGQTDGESVVIGELSFIVHF